MDQCTHCTMRGNLQGCLATKCNQHESWMVGELRQILVDVKNEVFDNLPSEDNAVRCTPSERLAHSVYLIAMRAWVSSNVKLTGSPASGESELNDRLEGFLE